MKQGHFYFIADDFYAVHDEDHRLMRNKETVAGKEHSRPSFYAFKDSRNPGIFWCVPISSKVEKYTEIYERKIEGQRERGVENPKCNTICFGEVMGVTRAFLIQNMFPVTEKYIDSIYMDRNTKMPVTIEPKTERLILNNARDILRLVKRGNHNLVFSDILKTYNDLCEEMDDRNDCNTSQIVFESNRGIVFKRTNITKNVCRLDVIDNSNGETAMSYQYKDVPGLNSPYISWENLNCCNGWVHDDTYLFTAVQDGKKLYAGIVLSVYNDDYAARVNAERRNKLLTEKDAEALIEKLKSDLPDDCVMGSDLPDDPRYNCRWKYIFICRTGAIRDYINLGDVFLAYERFGVELDDAVKNEVNRLCAMPIKDLAVGNPDYDYANPSDMVQLITTGLLLGYPVETTAYLVMSENGMPIPQ